MIHKNLRSIAEQHHPGMAHTEIDFGGEPLSHMDKLYQVYLAVREFPMPDPMSNPSNEVVLPARDTQRRHPTNIQPLACSRNERMPMPILKSKTRQKLTAADLLQKEEFQDWLLDAEDALLNAHDAFRAGSGDWDEVVRLDRDYRQLMDEANTFIAVVLDARQK